MKRTLLIVLSVAALVGYKAFNDARHDVAGANQSRCAVIPPEKSARQK
ncbi:hypothetical protein AAIH51_33100 [Pseudomonas aeruginosa]